MAENSVQGIQEFEYKAEMKQLLHLIVHSLYTHPEVFLRELISNASDALNQIRFRQLTDSNILNPDAPLRITINVDPKAQTFAITDTGVGMSREDLIERIGTVASSGTLEFLRKLKAQNKPFDGRLIGQFGIGFYSVFMVADEVTIETRHADADSKGYCWRSKGEGKYTVEEFPRQERGTKIYFKLKDEAKEFSEEFRVKEIIKRYSNFADFPIFVNGEQVNTISALWHRNRGEIKEEELNEFYKFISNDYNPPLGHLHLSIEGRVNFKALLFIPETPPLGFFRLEDMQAPNLYSKRILIQDDCKDLLPEYLHFISGVVDTEDLPLNVSRETVQSSPAMPRIREVLTGRIISLLEDWAKNHPEKYSKVIKNVGLLFKTGVSTDFTNKERLIELLRFESTQTEKGKYTSLKEYVERMPSDQTEIYYLAGDNREILERNPKLEYFKKKGVEVLFFVDPADVFNMPFMHEYKKKPLKSIEKADVDLKPDVNSQSDALSAAEAKTLISAFKETLGDRVADVVVSKRLVDSAATLVVSATALDTQTERLLKIMNREFTEAKKILEINVSHPLIKNLTQMHASKRNEKLLKDCILQIYEGALLVEGSIESPTDFVARMAEIMTEATR